METAEIALSIEMCKLVAEIGPIFQIRQSASAS